LCTFVFDFDFRPAHSVGDFLVPLLDVFVDHHLFFDTGILRNYCLLTLLLDLDGAILKARSFP
jgi:hypothetical protein